MYCGKCGARAEDGATFCSTCGYKLSRSYYMEKEKGNLKGRRSGKGLFVGIIAVLAAIAAVILLCVLTVGSHKTTVEEQLSQAWYLDGNSEPSFILYNDGTCLLCDEYGIGEWEVVNDTVLKFTNYYGETETTRIISVNDECLELENGMVYRSVPTEPKIETPPTGQPTSDSVRESIEVPEESEEVILATEGVSTENTQLIDISYNNEGKIISLTEKTSDGLTDWVYVYSNGGSFLYRKKNIGDIYMKWSSVLMPGTDITYTILTEPVDNCVGFTLEYEVEEVTAGDGLGTRDLYVMTGEDNWQKVAEFDYDYYGITVETFDLDKAIRLEAVATPRQHSDDSAFSVRQAISDIWVADYTYVGLAE